MKILSIALFIGFVFATAGFGQLPGDITYEKVFGGYKYSQGGVPVTLKQMETQMANNPDASAYISKAKTNLGASMVFSYAGGFLIGWPLGTAIAGGEPEWGMAAAGGALLLIGIPFSRAINSNTIKAIDIFNNQNSVAGNRSYTIHLGFTNSGLGVSLRF